MSTAGLVFFTVLAGIALLFLGLGIRRAWRAKRLLKSLEQYRRELVKMQRPKDEESQA